jgi:hypothetical protein
VVISDLPAKRRLSLINASLEERSSFYDARCCNNLISRIAVKVQLCAGDSNRQCYWKNGQVQKQGFKSITFKVEFELFESVPLQGGKPAYACQE